MEFDDIQRIRESEKDENDLAILEKVIHNANESLRSFQFQQRQLFRQKERLQKRYEEVEKENDELSNSYQEPPDLSDVKEESLSFFQKLRFLESQAHHYSSQKNSLILENRDLKLQITKFTKKQQQLYQTHQNLLNQMEDAKASLRSEQSNYENCNNTIADLDLTIKNLREEVERANENVKSKEQEIEKNDPNDLAILIEKRKTLREQLFKKKLNLKSFLKKKKHFQTKELMI